MIRLTLAVASTLALAACSAAPPEQPAFDPDAVLANIYDIQATQAAAVNAYNVEGATAPYSADAIFAGANMPLLQGSTAIRGGFDEMLADKGVALQITPIKGWVAATAESATTVSDYSFTTTGPDGTPVTERGFNQTLWHKDGDTWKIVVDSNTAIVPAEEAEMAEPAH